MLLKMRSHLVLELAGINQTLLGRCEGRIDGNVTYRDEAEFDAGNDYNKATVLYSVRLIPVIIPTKTEAPIKREYCIFLQSTTTCADVLYVSSCFHTTHKDCGKSVRCTHLFS